MANQADKSVLGAEDLIKYLLKEPKILKKVTSGLKPQARDYTNVWVDTESERIYFGKYAWSGFSEFWQKLIKCFDHISYDDFCIKVWDTLLEMTTDPIAHKAIMEGLSREVLLQGIHAKDQNILHRFFDVCRHITDDGYWRNQGTKAENPSHHINGCPYSDGVHIEVERQPRGKHDHITVYDCIGDVFEIFTGRWVGGNH